MKPVEFNSMSELKRKWMEQREQLAHQEMELFTLKKRETRYREILNNILDLPDNITCLSVKNFIKTETALMTFNGG